MKKCRRDRNLGQSGGYAGSSIFKLGEVGNVGRILPQSTAPCLGNFPCPQGRAVDLKARPEDSAVDLKLCPNPELEKLDKLDALGLVQFRSWKS